MSPYSYQNNNKEDLEKYYKKQKIKNNIIYILNIIIFIFAFIGFIHFIKIILNIL